MNESSPKTRAEINADSDAKAGIASKTYKLPKATIALIEQLKAETGIAQGNIIAEAVKLYAAQLQATKKAE